MAPAGARRRDVAGGGDHRGARGTGRRSSGRLHRPQAPAATGGGVAAHPYVPPIGLHPLARTAHLHLALQDPLVQGGGQHQGAGEDEPVGRRAERPLVARSLASRRRSWYWGPFAQK
jgi:hypothetical protein